MGHPVSTARKRLIRNAVLVTLALAATGLVVHIAQFFTVERHRGFFAPVWDGAGRSVYFIQRDTFGVAWGLGWEHFTPPANAYVVDDRLALRRLTPETGIAETLIVWDKTPVEGRVISEYRGRIFNILSARLDTDPRGVKYRVRMNVPRVPTSEHHSLRGRWAPGERTAVPWQPIDVSLLGYAEHRLVDGVELLTAPGREFFPAAVIAVDNDGGYRVLIQNAAFPELYPNGIPPKILRDRSFRETIERHREIARVRQELIDEYQAQGMGQGKALLEAADRLQELGYYPRGPQVVAKTLNESPRGMPIFEISEKEFQIGLFSDIRAAIAKPGEAIDKSMGRYIVHRDFDTSRRLNDWLEAGNTRFVIEHDGTVYALEIQR